MLKSSLRFIVLAFVTVVSVYAEVNFDKNIPQLSFAANRVTEALAGAKATVSITIQTNTQKPEAFVIRKTAPDSIRIIGTDAAGAMYGGLEVAEQILIGGVKNVAPTEQQPHMGMRGIKFNIPLDVRTPSYSDLGDAGQFNIPHVWDFAFWQEFIDEAASHRYNYISLWNLHPFPSLVKVPEYPDVALNDVKRAVDLERKYYDGRGQDYDAPEILDRTETVLSMSIDDKIAFWRKVMRYGKERHVDFYIVTWNAFDYGTAGKYGITDSLNNKVTIDYFRKSVKQLFITYPDLKGIGVTAGENMGKSSDLEKEEWLYNSYGLGVLDVVAEQPHRQITFLHRQHEGGAKEIAATFKKLIEHKQIDFIFSYKYAKAHAYSSTVQNFHKSFERDIKGASNNLKTIWTMRNDSTYLFRWSAPDFLRDYVKNIPKDITRGYYFGSDGWIWGRDFIHKEHQGPRRLEMQLHWMEWLLWGRLAYDPTLPNERLIGILKTHFPQVDAAQLFDAWQAASMVFPLTTGYHWGALDFQWYPEACVGASAKTKTGFHDVNRFISLSPHNGTDYVSIPDYVKVIKKGQSFADTGPLEVASELLANADKALSLIKMMQAKKNSELGETLADIEAMAYLGRYYGYKITGATQLHLFREIGDQKYQVAAVSALEQAAQVWRAYSAHVLQRFPNNMWLCRIRHGLINFEEITKWVDDDIDIAKKGVNKER